MDMADEQEHPHRRTSQAKAEAENAEVEARDEVTPAPPEVVDPYKQVLSPFELPANTAAAASIVATGNVAVDPDAPISDERVTQAKTNIQAHQDAIQEAMAGVTDDPRLGGSADFQEYNQAQAKAAADRAEKAQAEVEAEAEKVEAKA